MIKKFEEFVNEHIKIEPFDMDKMSKKSKSYDTQLMNYLFELGFDRNTINQILKQAQKVDFSYTSHEASDIFKRLPNCETLEDKINFVMYNFFTSKYDENGVFTYDWCKENHCPIVRGIDGKLLTGDVFYSSLLNEFGEDEDDFATSRVEQRVYDILLERDPEDAPLDDDLTGWFENNAWDYMDIKEINLDELFG
jgi:hypothetical protein